MKKKLEAELMSIAHGVLQMKNKSDINQLCIATQKLYEKLSVLRFVEEHFGEAKPTIGQAEIVEKMKQFFEDNNLSESKTTKIQDEIVVEKITTQEIIDESVIVGKNEDVIKEEIEEVAKIDFQEEEIIIEQPKAIEKSNDVSFLPAFELDIENQIEEPKKTEPVQISFEDLLGGDYSETLFIKADQGELAQTPIAFEMPAPEDLQEKESVSEKNETKTTTLNDKLSKGINIDLNDRIAFVKHLFANSDEDYNRVLNQLITYDNFEEAQNFIDDMVKPDYNSWEGKEDYSQRFIEIIEKKFD
jgi:hypothetical protein